MYTYVYIYICIHMCVCVWVCIFICVQAAGDNLERCIKAVAALTRDLGTYADVC